MSRKRSSSGSYTGKDEGISYEQFQVMRKWSERQRKNAPEDDEQCPDDILDDPLLIILWNLPGLAHRVALNALHTKASLVAAIDGDPSATIERDDAGNALDSVWSFPRMRELTHVLGVLGRAPHDWSRHVNGAADVGTAVLVEARRANRETVTPMPNVFN